MPAGQQKKQEATKKARSRRGEVHPMYSIHGTEVSCEQFQFVRLHLQLTIAHMVGRLKIELNSYKLIILF